ncbi:MAG: GNAT family N-acetyltransferase, partial [Isosphaeraceae bacterium]
ATHPDCRRQGIGRQMVNKLVSKLSSQRRNRIALCVRETNLPSQFFFRTVGFRAVEVLREHFPDTGEDGYTMLYHLDESVIESPPSVNRIARQLGS